MSRPSTWEWLALVVVLLVGWAIVAPVHKAAGPPSMRNSYLTDMKQTALALVLYAGDENERFPSRDLWIDAAFPYTKSEQIFHCPQAVGRWGYAFNGALDHAKMPKRPEAVPLVYDSVNPTKNASDLFASVPAVPRHGRNVVGYADGHAKALPVPPVVH